MSRSAISTHSYLYAKLYLRTAISTHSYLYAQLSLRTAISTHSYLYAQLSLRTDISTHRHLYAQTSLRTAISTHSYLYARLSLHTTISTRSYLYAQLSLRPAISTLGLTKEKCQSFYVFQINDVESQLYNWTVNAMNRGGRRFWLESAIFEVQFLVMNRVRLNLSKVGSRLNCSSGFTSL